MFYNYINRHKESNILFVWPHYWVDDIKPAVGLSPHQITARFHH